MKCLANPSRRVRWLFFLGLAGLALAVRLVQLGARPMHTDESVNAYLIGRVLEGEALQYDPRDRHGPALAAFTLPLLRLQGVRSFAELTESRLRLAPVLAGAATVLMLGAGMEMFGFSACLAAALLFAFAPLPLYYSRYFIHETLFVAATLGFILSGWRTCKTNSVLFSALAGICAALMLACKETAPLHFLALAAAGFFGWLLNPQRSSGAFDKTKIVLPALATFVAGVILLFTWFGQNWRGLSDLAAAIPAYAARAGGAGHEKPFWYYAVLLGDGWSGGILGALAVGGMMISFHGFARWRIMNPAVLMSLYLLAIFAVYSAIPYKTPWLALNMLLPMTVCSGVFIAWMLSSLKSSLAGILFSLGLAVVALAIFRDTSDWVFLRPADEQNPYAYAQTGEDLLRLPVRLEQLTKAEKLKQPLIAVIAADPWPLPWYLRKFQRVGFWQPGQDPGQADFYITPLERMDEFGDKAKDLRPEFFGVRPGVLMVLWSPKDDAP